MRKFLILIVALIAGSSTLVAEEQEKNLSSEERERLIHQTLSTRTVQFVIDSWGGSGVECKQLDATSTGFQVNSKKPKVKFDRGHEITAMDFINGYLYVFEHDEKHYAISMSDLQFVNDEDAKQIPFMLTSSQKKLNSLAGRFYGTSAALWTMLIIMAAAALVSLIYLKTKSESLRPIFLAIVPAAILVFSAIEIFGFIKFGSDMFWWCDYDRYGFWGSLLRVIPFAIMVAAQVYSIKIYERALFDERGNNDSGTQKISLKPAAWSLALCIPITLAVIIIMALSGFNNSIIMDIVCIATFLASLGIGLYISFKRNIKTLGATTGIWVSAFSVIYIIGCLISAIAMITLIFKIILQILVVIGTIFILLMVANTKQKRRIYRGNNVYEVED